MVSLNGVRKSYVDQARNLESLNVIYVSTIDLEQWSVRGRRAREEEWGFSLCSHRLGWTFKRRSEDDTKVV